MINLKFGLTLGSGYVVTGAGSDTTAPALVSAAIAADGLSTALTYSEALDAGSVPAAAAYVLGGTVVTVSSVAIVGATVTLTHSAAIPRTVAITLSYTPGGAPVRDAALNNATGFIGQALTNGSTVVPQDPLARFGSAMKLRLRSDRVTLSGANVTAALDDSVSALNLSPVGTVTQIASDPTPGGRDTPTIRMGTTGSYLTNGLNRLGPGANPHFQYAVIKMADWVSSKRIIGNATGSNNNQALVQSIGNPGLIGVNSSGGNPSYAGPLNQWMLIIQQFSGANTVASRTQDHIWIRGGLNAGVNWGAVTTRTGSSIGRGLNMDVKEWGIVDGVMTDADMDAIIAYVEDQHGSDTVRAPLNASTRLVIGTGQSNEIIQQSSGVGSSFQHSVPFAVQVRTSASADVASYPLLLRRPRTRHGVVTLGNYGPEVSCTADLLTAGRIPRAYLKSAIGSTNMVEDVSGTPGTLRRALFAEFKGELDGITKVFWGISRGETDCTESISQATARTRANALLASYVADIMAVCPNLPQSGIWFVWNEINTAMVPGAAFIAGVNAGILQAIGDYNAALGLTRAQQLALSDLPLSGDNQHYGTAGSEAIGSRRATAFGANW